MDAALLQTATVADAMSRDVPTVSPDLPLSEAAQMLRYNRRGALAVTTGSDDVAIITEFDIVRAVGNGEPLADLTVADHLTRVVVAAAPDWSLDRAIDTMIQGRFRHLVVVEDGITVGMVAMPDIMEILRPAHDHPSTEETVELAAVDAGPSRVIHLLRSGAKQHMAAIQCYCELDWIDVLIGQAEERPDLTAEEVEALWNLRQPCPTLNAEGGGAD